MPELDVLITNWEKLGGSYWGYDQTAYLKKNGTVTTYGGIDATKNKWEKPVTRDVSVGICHALSLRFVEGRMVGLDEEQVWQMLKGSFELSKLQQAIVFEEKSAYTAGGGQGQDPIGIHDSSREQSARARRFARWLPWPLHLYHVVRGQRDRPYRGLRFAGPAVLVLRREQWDVCRAEEVSPDA
jgi:hypothetical protein